MTYEEQIAAEQSIITSLRNRLKNIRLPARTINWQHRNLGKVRNDVQQRLAYKKQKAQVNSEIKASQNKIISLREALFGGL